ARRLAGRVRAPRFAVLARVRDAYRAAHRRSGARRRGGALRTLLPRLPRALRLPRAVGLRGRLPVERAHRSRRRPCRRGLRRGAHGDLRAMSTSCSVRRGDPGGAFLATARGEPASRRPVWIMRQAGRHLPEYRALRERHAFLELCETPELAATATLQPLERYDLDAAILFTDLLVPVVPMGVGLAYEPGPVLERTIRDRAAVESLRIPDPQEELAPMLETARLVRERLDPGKALIGFVGAPFTVACYLVEGRGSKSWDATRRLMYASPETFDALLERIAAALEPL